MVSFDLSFISTLIKDFVENEGAHWTEGRISWLTINIGSYQGWRVHVVGEKICPCVRLLLGAPFRVYGCFIGGIITQNSKTQKQDCMQTYLFFAIDN